MRSPNWVPAKAAPTIEPEIEILNPPRPSFKINNTQPWRCFILRARAFPKNLKPSFSTRLKTLPFHFREIFSQNFINDASPVPTATHVFHP